MDEIRAVAIPISSIVYIRAARVQKRNPKTLSRPNPRARKIEFLKNGSLREPEIFLIDILDSISMVHLKHAEICC